MAITEYISYCHRASVETHFIMSYQKEFTKDMSGERKKRFGNEKQGYSDPSVLVGQWFEERARKEADYAEFLYNYGNENTPLQKFMKYEATLNNSTSLTESRDGYLHNKDAVNIRWNTKLSDPRSAQKQHIYLSALPYEIAGTEDFALPCIATAAMPKNGNISRCTFYICRANTAIPDCVPLMYNECIQIITVGKTRGLFLYSELRTPSVRSKRSGHQETKWVESPSHLTLWRVLKINKEENTRLRMESVFRSKQEFIPVNTELLINHVATGNRLALEKNHSFETVLGHEWEISCNNYAKSPSVEGKENIWKICTPYPKDLLKGLNSACACNARM